MDGPINFGENDSYWGLLVEGFMQQSYGMPYNKDITRSSSNHMGSLTILNSIHTTKKSEDQK